MMVPFVKWAGGKRQMLEQLTLRMPDEYGIYYEPFVGGGALAPVSYTHLDVYKRQGSTVSDRRWYYSGY